MNLFNKTYPDAEGRQLTQLLQVVKEDSIINKKLIQLLKLDSYHRRNVLNRWLEQLRRKHASENLIEGLSYLFDDKVAKKVLTFINNHQTLTN